MSIVSLKMSSRKRTTALKFLETFSTLDSTTNTSLRAPNCRHTIAPMSLGYTPDMTNEQWVTHLEPLKQILTAFPVTPTEIFEDEGSKQVTVWATSDAVFKDEVKDDDQSVEWRYQGEYMFVFLFNDDDNKIERILEFVDSRRVLEVRELFARAMGNLMAREKRSL